MCMSEVQKEGCREHRDIYEGKLIVVMTLVMEYCMPETQL